MRKPALVAALLALSACAASTQMATGLALPKERATECAANCDALDMRLAAVVIIMNSTGCVCEPKGSAPSSSTGPGAAGAAGGAAIAVVAAAAAHERRQQSASVPTHR